MACATFQPRIPSLTRLGLGNPDQAGTEVGQTGSRPTRQSTREQSNRSPLSRAARRLCAACVLASEVRVPLTLVAWMIGWKRHLPATLSFPRFPAFGEGHARFNTAVYHTCSPLAGLTGPLSLAPASSLAKGHGTPPTSSLFHPLSYPTCMKCRHGRPSHT